MEPIDLKTPELKYELLCRNVVPKDKPDLRRAQLRGVLLKKAKIPVLKSPYEFADDVVEIKNTIADLSSILEDDSLTMSKSLLRRINSRFSHLENRLNLLIAQGEEEGKIKLDLEFDFCMLQGLLCYRENDDDDSDEQEGESVSSLPKNYLVTPSVVQSNDQLCISDTPLNPSTGENQHPISVATAARPPSGINYIASNDRQTSVPVFKWNVTFSGQIQREGLLSFLEKVEELRIARNISKEELFTSAIDLFSGQALLWFRNIKSHISNWEELVHNLRKDFLPVDYEHDLWLEILNRTQGLYENVIMYITSVESLFRRLEKKYSEDEILRQIIRNLNPFFSDRISAYDITSLDDLKDKCRKIQEIKVRNERYKPPPSRKSGLLEPEMACLSLVNSDSPTVSALSHASSPVRLCWNCGQKGHIYPNCRAARTVFCFGCGRKDTFKTSCPSCSPKNETTRVAQANNVAGTSGLHSSGATLGNPKPIGRNQ